MNRGFLKVLLFFLVFFAFAVPLFAGGAKEDRIKAAEKLMEKKLYNEAMNLLSNTMKEEPDKMDRAIQLMDKIMAIITEYTDKLIELAQINDYQEIIETIDEMVDIYPYPDASGQNTLNFAQNHAKQVGNRNYFAALMEETLVLVKQAAYFAAVEKYAGAFTANPDFDLHKSDYEAAKLGNIVKTTLDEKIKAITQNIGLFLQKTTILKKNTDKLISGLTAFTYTEMQDSTDLIITGFLEILDMAGLIKSSGEILKLQMDKLTEQDDNADLTNSHNYLNYFYQLITGRTAHKEDEGILYAINAMVASDSNALVALMKTLADENFNQGIQLFKDITKYEESLVYIKKAFNLYTVIVQFAYFTDKKEKLVDYSVITRKGWRFEESLTNYLKAIVDVKSANSYEVLIDELKALPYFKQINLTPGKEETERIKIEMIRILNSVREVAEDWQTYLLYGNISLGLEFDKQKADTIIALSSDILSHFITEYLRIMGLVYTDFTARSDKEIGLLQNGIVTRLSDDLIGIGQLIRFYPGERKAAFTALQNEVTDFKTNITEISAAWSYSTELAAESAELSSGIGALSAFAANIDNLITALYKAITQAETNIRDGLKFKEEGILRYEQAETASNKGDYINARKRIADASDAFDKSLAKNEDAEVRKYREETLLELDKKIGNAENIIVIKEVSRLKKEGRDFYSKGLYDEAEKVLTTAQFRWGEVKTEKDIEIEEWLGYVRTANKIKRAREIPETDPLYTEMSLLANYAKKNYSDGITLKKAGKKEEATALFNEAEDKVLRILLSFPYNNNARVLGLRIQREIDPAAFNKEIEKRLNEAREQITASNQDKVRDGYNSLKDIAAIDPNNKAVANEIIKAEYKLGIRLPAPDLKAIAEAKRLTEDARKIIDNKNRDLFAAALVSLNEAIKKDPNNDLARQLKDEIYISEGGQQTTVISQETVNEYNRALEFYLAGNYLAARQIVDRAWNDSRNRGYRKLQDLREKINLKLQ